MVQCKEKEKGEGMGKKGRGKEKLAALDTIHQLMNEPKVLGHLGRGYVEDDGHVVVNESKKSLSVEPEKGVVNLKVK